MLYRGPKTAGGWLKNRKTPTKPVAKTRTQMQYHFSLPRRRCLFLRQLIGFGALASI